PRPAFWLLAAGLLTALVSYFGAIGQSVSLIDIRFGARYAFVPQALFGLALLAFASTTTPRFAWLAWVFVAWQLAVGTVQFARPWSLVSNGPAWRPEIAAWRLDPTHQIRTWPDGWRIVLDPAHRRLGS
ncbi:MAG: hypothetical protein ACRYFY_19790, partial [Janthinobacterium lividum]